MAAVCNFVGLFARVAVLLGGGGHTIFNMVDFGGNSHQALTALMAAMVAIIVWGAAAWWFGIPTCQIPFAHRGAHGGRHRSCRAASTPSTGAEWIKVIYGILLSTLLGFGSWVGSTTSSSGGICRHVNRQQGRRLVLQVGPQIVAGAGVAFMHGAQDGQKFMSIFMLAIMMTAGMGMDLTAQWRCPCGSCCFCAFNMGLGTAVGGERIIKSVGMDMVKLEAFQGFAASLSTFVSLMLATFGGLAGLHHAYEHDGHHGRGGREEPQEP